MLPIWFFISLIRQVSIGRQIAWPVVIARAERLGDQTPSRKEKPP